ncbi:MobA/MobL family protein [Escherichia coli]|nr:MobA/MobL family protein [Escherichia coli]EFC7484146.1 MobA/MobL family protein [Escherichia coli]EFC8033047.1 MobA/MobL family protein [Escherichia coli]EFC8383320.1 MobA/MobL family protein [Escherichia coli]EFC8404100.1 MobA/MobL family protein [Escherichia coli]
MASYHCTVKTGAKGVALKHADYISRSGEYKNYKSREDLEFSSSGNMPSWAKKNPAELWKAADEFERKNGTAYREIEIALPRELTREQRIELVEDFVQKELGDRHAYQYAIHNPLGAIDGKEQPHAHIMFCERINDGIERDPQQFFKRANSKSPERGGAKKARFGETPQERKSALVALRSHWADVQNEYLARHGHQSRVDHRSLKEQGIKRTPEVHLGPVRVAVMNADQVCAILARRNAEREKLEAEQERDSIIDLKTTLKEALAERDNIPPSLDELGAELKAFVESSFDELNEVMQLNSLINGALDSMMKQFQVEEERKLQQERLIEAEKQRDLERERERVRQRAYSSPAPAPSRSRDYGMSR